MNISLIPKSQKAISQIKFYMGSQTSLSSLFVSAFLYFLCTWESIFRVQYNCESVKYNNILFACFMFGISLGLYSLFPMEEKRKQVRDYLEGQVNPIIRPLVEEIVRKRPSNIAAFINEYSFRLMAQKHPEDIHSDSDEETEEMQAEFLRKLEEKKKKKMEKKNSRQGISAEVFGQFNKKADFAKKVIPKDAATKDEIKRLIEKSILFQSLNKEDLGIVIDAMEEVHAEPGQSIITEGQRGDTLFIIDQGEFDCFKIINSKQTYLKTYHPGEFFGELALMYNAPRAASIKCKIAGKLFGLDRATFNHIVQEAATKKRKYYSEILSKVEILAEIDPYEKEQLCDSLKEEEFPAGSYIVKQGDQGDRFYIISQGKLIAEKKESPTAPVRKVFEYKEGDYFGEIALVKNTVRQASVKAETDCRVVSIERDAFKRLLGPIEDILQRNMDKYKKYLIQ